jgi:hypothetical protein
VVPKYSDLQSCCNCSRQIDLAAVINSVGIEIV